MESTDNSKCNCEDNDGKMFSIPISGMLALQRAFARARGAAAVPDENQTFYLGERVAGMSSTSQISQLDGVTSGSAQGLTQDGISIMISVRHDQKNAEKLEVTLTQSRVGGPSTTIGFDYALNATSAKLIDTHLPVEGTAGLDVWCIIQAGGGTILSTIVQNLPALATGNFVGALLGVLGRDAVDLVNRVVKCFG